MNGLSPLTPSTLSHGSPRPPAASDEWLQDLELMHHYTSKTSRSELGSGHAMKHLWQENIPLEATKHPFLMHGILALSALHIAATVPSKPAAYLQISDKHHVIAVSSFRELLSEPVTDDQGNALFALSMVLSVSSLARASLRTVERPERRFMALEDVVELLYMTRGVRDVVDTTYETVSRGPFSVALHGHQAVPSAAHALAPQLKACFSALSSLCDDISDPEKSRLCMEAVTDLQTVYETAVQTHATQALHSGHIFRWVAERSYEFLKLVQTRHPPALVITAYFFVSTGMLEHSWYLRDLAQLGFNGVANALEADYGKHLAYARELIASDLAVMKSGR
ncbi:hypothetical protein LTR95_017100 [Oleoguttula sp. CCFEE 5521]